MAGRHLRRILILNISPLIAAALACSLPGLTPSDDAASGAQTAVSLTLTASIPEQPLAPSDTPEPTAGTVSGSLCYPSEPPLPEITIFFEDTSTHNVITYPHDDGTGVYSVELPPGNYVAYAWRIEYGLGGSYSQAVACGLSVNCTDHSLIPFTVTAGATTGGIDICDWYGGEGSVPTPPSGLTAGDLSNVTSTATPPPGGVSLNCDGTYQRVRITDGGATGKTVSVDRWDGTNWVNAWNLEGGDPMQRQILDDAGDYPFGDCQRLVVVPIRYSGPHLWLELSAYRWNGTGLDQVYFNAGYYGQWSRSGDTISFTGATSLGGSPLAACDTQTSEHTWDGSAFVQTGSSITPVPGCTPVVTASP